MFRVYKRLALAFFGRFGEGETFKKLNYHLQAAGIKLMLKTYASITLFTCVLVYILSLLSIVTASSILQLPFLSLLLYAVTLPVFFSTTAFLLLYFYPSQKAASIKKNLENDLPFAVAHMSAIASSGISPEAMFELLTGFKEYKEIARHSSLIVRNMKTFGMSSVTAIAAVAQTTPSQDVKQLLNGIAFTLEKGGNLSHYLKEISEKSLFEYRIKREKYLKTLSTYADIYTALIVAAPLMMLSLLGILSVIGGEIVGLTISELITVLTFLILPFMNIAFLAFIHLTYPGV